MNAIGVGYAASTRAAARPVIAINGIAVAPLSFFAGSAAFRSGIDFLDDRNLANRRPY
jgi:hypothetical protein